MHQAHKSILPHVRCCIWYRQVCLWFHRVAAKFRRTSEISKTVGMWKKFLFRADAVMDASTRIPLLRPETSMWILGIPLKKIPGRCSSWIWQIRSIQAACEGGQGRRKRICADFQGWGSEGNWFGNEKDHGYRDLSRQDQRKDIRSDTATHRGDIAMNKRKLRKPFIQQFYRHNKLNFSLSMLATAVMAFVNLVISKKLF